MTMDELFFFDGKPEELALYETLPDRIKALGAFTAIAHKTQISLKNRRVFACVSVFRVLPKRLLPAHYLVLTLGLPDPLDSPRIAAKTEAQPGRWTHHIVLAGASELDAELLEWIRRAYAFGNRI
jgi:hypothetical protein